MSFDPTLPVNGSQVSSAELRAQLNALKALYDAQAVQIAILSSQVLARPDTATVLDLIANNAASPVLGMAQLTLAFDDPPTSVQLDDVRDKINELMSGLQTH